ncbi:hypothetical protein Q4511_03215 [Paracoccus sp. 1_MG-2023]|nr:MULTISPECIES: hypothetical protein [unclassified Paracoccus (in: a-proteobacteria)]MBU2956245.1 hypothetical protein [Paracoccus sp. C2R09]MDO6667922.1 hypothetical protein [Paracoccus sp. 1_MG-2023]
MIAYRHVTTFGVTQQRWLSSITDLVIAEVGGELTLLAATQVGGGLSSYRLSGAGTAITALRTRAYSSSATFQGDPELHLLDVAGSPMVHLGSLGGAADQAVGLQPSNGALTAFGRLFGTDLGERLTALGQVATAGGTVVFSASGDGLVLQTHRMDADGRLTVADSATLPVPAGSTDAHLDHVLAAEVEGRTVLIAASGNGNFLSTHLMSATGRLSGGQVYSAANGAGFDLPSAMVVVQFADAGFVVLGGAGSNSLSVFAIGADGTIARADHVLDEGGTRFQSVTALESVVIGDRAFLFAGGADDGITVLTMLPDGRLVHLATIADTDAMTLADVSDIAAVVVDGQISVVVASSSEAGLTQFVFDPGTLGVTRIAGAGTVSGGASNDILQASGATTRLNGGGGRRHPGGGGPRAGPAWRRRCRHLHADQHRGPDHHPGLPQGDRHAGFFAAGQCPQHLADELRAHPDRHPDHLGRDDPGHHRRRRAFPAGFGFRQRDVPPGPLRPARGGSRQDRPRRYALGRGKLDLRDRRERPAAGGRGARKDRGGGRERHGDGWGRA